MPYREEDVAGLRELLRQFGAESQFPLGFCPHDHRCALERLDARGAPIGKPIPMEEEWWFRSGR